MKNKNLLMLVLSLVFLPACVFKKDGAEVKTKKKKVKKTSFFSKGTGIPTSSRKDEGKYFDDEVERFALGEDEFDVAREMLVAQADKIDSDWKVVSDTDFSCESIHFDFDSSEIIEDEAGKLAYDVEHIKEWLDKEDTAITLEGHSDRHYVSKTYNIAVSEKRAQKVKEKLVESGIEPDRVKIVAYGDMKPVVDVTGKERRNRRVDFVEVVAKSEATSTRVASAA